MCTFAPRCSHGTPKDMDTITNQKQKLLNEIAEAALTAETLLFIFDHLRIASADVNQLSLVRTKLSEAMNLMLKIQYRL